LSNTADQKSLKQVILMVTNNLPGDWISSEVLVDIEAALSALRDTQDIDYGLEAQTSLAGRVADLLAFVKIVLATRQPSLEAAAGKLDSEFRERFSSSTATERKSLVDRSIKSSQEYISIQQNLGVLKVLCDYMSDNLFLAYDRGKTLRERSMNLRQERWEEGRASS
jgi:hypothetical protein